MPKARAVRKPARWWAAISAAPWWAGVSGIVGVLALVVALVALVFPSTGSAGGESPQHLLAVAEPLGGDCASPGWVLPDQGAATVAFGSRPAGAALAGGGVVGVTLQGATDSAIVLVGADVEIVKRSALPPARELLRPRCGGDQAVRNFLVNLDGKAPRLQPGKGSTFPFKVSSGDPERWIVRADTSGLVEWRLRVHWNAEGTSGTLIVDDNGRPFRSESEVGAHPFCATDHAWRRAGCG